MCISDIDLAHIAQAKLKTTECQREVQELGDQARFGLAKSGFYHGDASRMWGLHVIIESIMNRPQAGVLSRAVRRQRGR